MGVLCAWDQATYRHYQGSNHKVLSDRTEVPLHVLCSPQPSARRRRIMTARTNRVHWSNRHSPSRRQTSPESTWPQADLPGKRGTRRPSSSV
ncbi:hypothetical protein GCM10010417_40980 [Streptomyces carpaticus]